MGKEPRSFSIDEDLNELLKQRRDINASALVNSFLREYVTEGKGREAALDSRLSELDEQIADLEKELTQKQRERDRIHSQLKRERESKDEMVDELVEMIRNDSFPRSNLTPTNGAVVKRASDAGLPAERYIEEVEMRL
jgi:septal ring factor EnvC (AmiA/AmiB activator)